MTPRNKLRLRRITAGTVTAALAAITWWLGGYDFNERNDIAAICFVSLLVAFNIGWIMPVARSNEL